MILHYFQRKNKRAIKSDVRNASGHRTDIEKYVKYAFLQKYEMMQSQGNLDSFLDECETYFEDAFSSLQKMNNKKDQYYDAEEQEYFYSSLALSEVYAEIYGKLGT